MVLEPRFGEVLVCNATMNTRKEVHMESEQNKYTSERGKVGLSELLEERGRVEDTKVLLALGIGGDFQSADYHLARYSRMLEIEVEMLKSYFSGNEWLMLFNVGMGGAHGSCEGAIEEELVDHYDNEFEAFGIEKNSLVAKVRELNIGQKFALINFLESYWQLPAPCLVPEWEKERPSFEEYLAPRTARSYVYLHN
jgi:hypothetical protein